MQVSRYSIPFDSYGTCSNSLASKQRSGSKIPRLSRISDLLGLAVARGGPMQPAPPTTVAHWTPDTRVAHRHRFLRQSGHCGPLCTVHQCTYSSLKMVGRGVWHVGLVLIRNLLSCTCRRSYPAESTGSHPNSEVKLLRDRLVLRWGTTRESWLTATLFFPLSFFHLYSGYIRLRYSKI